MSELDLDKIFTYHAPRGDQADRYERIRDAARVFAEEIIGLSPESRERTHAINKVQEAVMWANAGIARNEDEPQTVVSADGKSFMDVPRPGK